MSRSHKGYRNILCIIDEVTNYLITVSIHQARSEKIGEDLIEQCYNKVKVKGKGKGINMI